MGLLGTLNFYEGNRDLGQQPQQGSPGSLTEPITPMFNEIREARLAQAAKYQAEHDQLTAKRNAPITGDLALYRSGQSGERPASTDPMSAAKPASAAGMQLGRHKSIGLGRTKF